MSPYAGDGGWLRMALDAQIQATAEQLDPTQLSAAGVWRTYRQLIRDYHHPLERRPSLAAQLGRALRDTYQRQNKSSRNYPRKKRPDSPPRAPEILNATADEILIARIHRYAISKGVTA